MAKKGQNSKKHDDCEFKLKEIKESNEEGKPSRYLSNLVRSH
ncbi:MAG: hypothetical protein ACTSWK_11180 [Promethearchaeota archaeon]